MQSLSFFLPWFFLISFSLAARVALVANALVLAPAQELGGLLDKTNRAGRASRQNQSVLRAMLSSSPTYLLVVLPALVWSWALGLAGGWFLYRESRPFRQQWVLRRHGRAAMATITSVDAAAEGDVLHLRFETPAGVGVVVPAAACVAPRECRLGEHLAVRYHPRNSQLCLALAPLHSSAPRTELLFAIGFVLLVLAIYHPARVGIW